MQLSKIAGKDVWLKAAFYILNLLGISYTFFLKEILVGQQKTNSLYARYSFAIFQLRLSYRRAVRFQNAWACGCWGV
jgi:hypothetical protein